MELECIRESFETFFSDYSYITFSGRSNGQYGGLHTPRVGDSAQLGQWNDGVAFTNVRAVSAFRVPRRGWFYVMNVKQFETANAEYVTLVLERRQIETAIGALIALDLSRGNDHPAITSALTALRSQLKKFDAKAA